MIELIDDYMDDSNRPPVLRPEGYHGIIADIVKAATQSSEASPVAVAANFISTFSAMVGRNPNQWIGDSVCHARPFFLLCGKTGKARKGTSEHTIRAIFNATEILLNNSEWPTLKRHEGGLSSGEGLGWAIRDLVEEPDKSGTMISNGGTNDKRLYVTESEFGGTIDIANRERNSLSATIRTCFDGKTIAPLVKNSAWSATNPHIVIVGHITSTEFLSKMSVVDAHSGFLNRFIILHIARPKLVALPNRTKPELIDQLAAKVAEILSHAVLDNDPTSNNTLEISLSRDAAAYWCENYKDITSEDAGIAGALLVRTELYARMLSMLFCLIDKETTVSVSHIKSALAWIDYWRDSVNYIFSSVAARVQNEKIKEDAEKVLKYIKRYSGCSRSDLTISIKGISPLEITNALNYLLNSAPPLITYKEIPRSDGKKGRCKTIYFSAINP